MSTIIVTRHPALLELLKERGVIADDAQVIRDATVELVAGKQVIGNLPLHLACHAKSVAAVTIRTPPHLRGKELNITQLREYTSQEMVTYIIEKQ